MTLLSHLPRTPPRFCFKFFFKSNFFIIDCFCQFHSKFLQKNENTSVITCLYLFELQLTSLAMCLGLEGERSGCGTKLAKAWKKYVQEQFFHRLFLALKPLYLKFLAAVVRNFSFLLKLSEDVSYRPKEPTEHQLFLKRAHSPRVYLPT